MTVYRRAWIISGRKLNMMALSSNIRQQNQNHSGMPIGFSLTSTINSRLEIGVWNKFENKSGTEAAMTWKNFNWLNFPFSRWFFAGNFQSFKVCFQYIFVNDIFWQEIVCSRLIVNYMNLAIQNAKNDILFEIVKVFFGVLEIIKFFWIQIDSGFWCCMSTEIESPVEVGSLQTEIHSF